MSSGSSHPQPSPSQLCQDCHQFFGSAETAYRCSVCYKNYQQRHPELVSGTSPTRTESSPPEAVSPSQQPAVEQKDKTRCYSCNKKLNLLGINCRCGAVVCSTHRNRHNCTYDYRSEQQAKLKQDIPKVAPSSVSKL
ncbi:hypothetical protein P9112_012646 [Eukaryota sp. TZLM1-RC]